VEAHQPEEVLLGRETEHTGQADLWVEAPVRTDYVEAAGWPLVGVRVVPEPEAGCTAVRPALEHIC
jgi:hypothetical protein